MSPRAPIIGLEIHVQLKTGSKLFCGDAAAFEADPNTNVCPVCLGLPGALPVPNRHAVELALRAAAALQCTTHHTSEFVRKNYFYPDLPKGYQITQYEAPLATNGTLVLRDGTRTRIRRVHLEEDAGKMLHDRIANRTAIDMNRAGIPLLEIVTEPDLRSPAHARAFLTLLRQTLQYVEVSDCEMEKGSLRVDANVSLVSAGAGPDEAPRTELKNLNSFAAIERALHAEIARQEEEIAAGRPIAGQTLSWNDVTARLRVMRAKEQSGDYRYIREPDLPPLAVSDAAVASARAALPELPLARADRLRRQYGLRSGEADVLCASRPLADYFEELARLTSDPHASAAWTMREVLSAINTLTSDFPVAAARLAELILMVKSGRLSSAASRSVFRRMCESGSSAAQVVAAAGLAAMDASGEAEAWALEIVGGHPRELERLRRGESRIFEFFVGELMRRSNGRLDPHVARDIVSRVVQPD